MAVIDKITNEFIEKKICVTTTDEKNTINLFYQNQMTSNYKMEEQRLQDIVTRNIISRNDNERVKLHIYYRNRKLKSLVIRNNPHKPADAFNVVYQYTCEHEECNSSSTYIGYTEATLTERLRNHTQHGSIIKHLREKHGIRKMATKDLVKSVTVLGKANCRSDLLILEALLIKDFKPTLNEQEEGRDRILHIF
jgi:DNA-binding HxlR family transcriptional regulator